MKLKAISTFKKINRKVGFGNFHFPNPRGLTIRKDHLEYSLPPAVRSCIYQGGPTTGVRVTVIFEKECVFLAEKWRDSFLPDIFIFKEGEWVKALSKYL